MNQLGPVKVHGEIVNARRRDVPLLKAYTILPEDFMLIAYIKRTIPQVTPGWVLVMHADQGFEAMNGDGFKRMYEVVEMNQNDNGGPTDGFDD